ncbi:MAG: monovalent cation/H+ antiporter subunit D family protein, partial [Nevskiaceae bacterium]
AWSKFVLAVGAVEADRLLLVAVLMASSLLNVVYLMGPVMRGFFRPPPADAPAGLQEAPVACVVPLCLTALACVALFFLAEPLLRPVARLLGAP